MFMMQSHEVLMFVFKFNNLYLQHISPIFET